MTNQASAIVLPASFPRRDYTPFGYIDNPYHSAVFNRSGVIRSVPPVGFGFWARRMPWPYGIGSRREVSYLSFMHLSFNIAGKVFHTTADFEKNGVRLVSRYHTKTMMSYDWEYRDFSFSARYFFSSEDALVCLLDIRSSGDTDRQITLHATNIYGWPEMRWWGSDGIAGSFNDKAKVGVSKIWAGGDVFVIGAKGQNPSYKCTGSESEWNSWINHNDLTSAEGQFTKFNFKAFDPEPGLDEDGRRLGPLLKSTGGLHSVLSYPIRIPAGGSVLCALSLARGVSQEAAVRAFQASLIDPVAMLNKQLEGDESFYSKAPLLVGDWPLEWQHGWTYDWQTVRMTIRPPVGIYKHPWDGMQIFTPRQVLAETAIDCMLLSYGDVELAKEVIYGTFADSPAANIPCTREDGSMNMISVAGDECGTAPNWCLPFHVIHSIYLRDHDDAWIRSLYPFLKKYLDWWLENRTDDEGWLYANNSWESGQDGSKRFLVEEQGDVADFVRTIDIEAAVAEAMQNMEVYASLLGNGKDQKTWKALARERRKRVQAMYFDGEFRDVDGRTSEPIILDDYRDVNMLAPFATGIATQAQAQASIPLFKYFQDHPRHWLEWPPYMMIYADGGWNAGLRAMVSEVIVEIGNRIYKRTDARMISKSAVMHKTGLPNKYDYRAPGIATEYWPIDGQDPGGGENYGWGGTLPIHVIRNIIGFRELDNLKADEFWLAPTFPASMAQRGKTYGMTQLRFRGFNFEVNYTFVSGAEIRITLVSLDQAPPTVTIKAENGDLVALSGNDGTSIEFDGMNGSVYLVELS